MFPQQLYWQVLLQFILVSACIERLRVSASNQLFSRQLYTLTQIEDIEHDV